MRLLQIRGNDELTITDDLIRNIPPYAVLSHTWGPWSDEVTFQDLIDGTGKYIPGYQKILFCMQQAKRDGLDYFWVDTCCIDKTSSAELSEAINSMFRWYQKAVHCYVHLSDVSIEADLGLASWESQFRKSRWFTRGWTLQELIAPASVRFYSRGGTLLGDKTTLEDVIHEITGLPIPVLRGHRLSDFSIEKRLSWSKDRHTTRHEDIAYCQLGILDVSMAVNYGEGEESAFRRLRREIEWSKCQPGLTLSRLMSSLLYPAFY